MSSDSGGGKRQARVLKGFRDYMPEQMILRQRIIGIFRTIFEQHGFEPLDTPALEYLDVLTGKAGENEKLMYRFEDAGGREVGLRYDLTVPLARVVAQHQNELVLPFKRYHIAPVWRAENPQRGRFREFWQCDADIAGSASPIADAEVIAIMAEALEAIGVPEFVIRISHRRLLESIGLAAGVPSEQATALYRAIDKLDKIGREGVAQELSDAGLNPAQAGRVLDLVTRTGTPAELLDALSVELAEVPGAPDAIADMRVIFDLLPAFGIAANRYALDLALARGLDYYTGPVFEATVTEPRVGSVGGAGRYDGLVGAFLGRPVPATGMSLGLERIIEVVREHNLLPAPSSVADVAVITLKDTVAAGARIASELRAAGLRADLSLQPQRGIGDQLKAADRRGIPLAVIVGSSEFAAGNATIKVLASGDQTTHALSDIPTTVSQLLAEATQAESSRTSAR
ncbi:MAG: histidine--tRNA ligase [Thermomicrobiales bacterium]